MDARCTVCKTVKSPSEFYADARRPLGLQSACKPCFRSRVKRYRTSARGRVVRRQYASRPEIHERINRQHREWLKTSNGRSRLQVYRRRKAYKRYRRMYERTYRKRPEAREHDRIRFHQYLARKRGTDDGTVTFEATVQLLAKQGCRCKLCSADLCVVTKHLDHIYPISRGGKHTLSNVQWLCYRCNIRKSNHV